MARAANSRSESSGGEGDASGRARRRLIRRCLTGGVALLAVVGFGAILVYAYNKGDQRTVEAAPVLLKPPPGPHKVRPVSPGGMVVPDRDKEVYKSIAAAPAPKKPERLMPGPEAPLPRPGAEAHGQPASTGDLQSAGEVLSGLAEQAEDLVTHAPRDPNGKPLTPAEPDPAASADKQPRTEAPPPSEAPQKKPRTLSKDVTGAFRVQIASLRSRDAVDRAWQRLLSQHQDLLAPLDIKIERADLGPPKGVYFRVQAGPFADRDAARRLCTQLAVRKVGCFVVGG